MGEMATVTEVATVVSGEHPLPPKGLSLEPVLPRPPRPHRWVSMWSRAWLAGLPAVAYGFVMVLSLRFYHVVGFSQPDFSLLSVVKLTGAPRTAESVKQEVITRLTWGLAGMCLVLALIAVVLASLWILMESLRERRAWLATFLVVPSALSMVVWWRFGAAANDGLDLTDKLIREALLQAGIPAAFEVGVRFGALALTGAMFMLAASCAIVLSSGWVIGGHVTLKDEDCELGPIRHLALRISWGRWLLYLGTVLLVAGVMEVGGFHRLPTPYLDPGDAKCVDAIASVTSLSVGTVLTLMLLAIYGPAALVLRMRVMAVAARENPRDPDAWIREHGLDSSMPQHLTRLGAVLAPLLAGGPLTMLLKAAGI